MEGLRLCELIGNPSKVIPVALSFLDKVLTAVNEKQRFRIVVEYDPEAAFTLTSIYKKHDQDNDWLQTCYHIMKEQRAETEKPDHGGA